MKDTRGLQLTIAAGTPLLTGLWCYRCMLPSMIVVPLSSLTPQGFSTMGLFAYCTGCRGCP